MMFGRMIETLVLATFGVGFAVGFAAGALLVWALS